MDNDIKKEIENSSEENSGTVFQSSKDVENYEQIDICEESNEDTAHIAETKSDDETGKILDEPIENTFAPRCERNEKVIGIGRKIGFYGLIGFMLISLLFGALSNYGVWQNRLNILFVGSAVLMYGIQNIITHAAIKKCRCMNCSLTKKRLETIIILCIAAFIVSAVLFIVLTVTDIA